MAGRKNNLGKILEFKAKNADLLSRSDLIKRPLITDLGQKVVSATVEEFATNGVQGARVAEICRRAGTTDPTFYRYFLGLRQAALFIISEYYWTPLNQRINHYREITGEPQQLFEAVVNSLINSAEDDSQRPWLSEAKVFQIVVAESRNPFLLPELALDDEYVGFLARLEEIIKNGQQQKTFQTDLRPALLASLLVNSLHGLLAQNAVRFRPFQVEETEVKRVAANIVGLK